MRPTIGTFPTKTCARSKWVHLLEKCHLVGAKVFLPPTYVGAASRKAGAAAGAGHARKQGKWRALVQAEPDLTRAFQFVPLAAESTGVLHSNTRQLFSQLVGGAGRQEAGSAGCRGVAAPAGGDSCLLAGGDDRGAAYLDRGADPVLEGSAAAAGSWCWWCLYMSGLCSSCGAVQANSRPPKPR